MDYDKIQQAIPVTVMPLMKPYIDRVVEAIKPGLESLSWTSLNIEECK